ncbi:MAG: hypothetical protein M3O82_01545, partial [Verrucomicrobiota bacterium]|nr:hypothetical protein [Verrucomicrobiota bacterium]
AARALLDEPFGALDAKVRKELRRWLRTFHDETHLTTLFVTHDQDEAFEVADRVVILHEGAIQQIGTVEELRRRPANRFIADFLDVPAIGMDNPPSFDFEMISPSAESVRQAEL